MTVAGLGGGRGPERAQTAIPAPGRDQCTGTWFPKVLQQEVCPHGNSWRCWRNRNSGQEKSTECNFLLSPPCLPSWPSISCCCLLSPFPCLQDSPPLTPGQTRKLSSAWLPAPSGRSWVLVTTREGFLLGIPVTSGQHHHPVALSGWRHSPLLL